MSHEGIQLDLQKALLSGVNSPAAVSSPSCEVRNELMFPSLPVAPTTTPQQQPPTTHQEPAKVTPKISQLSELDQQLSKLHNQRPVLPQPQGQMTQTYSEAVRQSPTTVQQQFAGQAFSGQVASPAQLQTPASPGGPVRKLSRFVISKVTEESKAQAQSEQVNQNQSINQNQQLQQQASQGQPQVAQKSIVNSPENPDQLMSSQQQLQNVIQSANVQPTMPQQNQAQLFFQLHHGGVVSVCIIHKLKRRFFLLTLFWLTKWRLDYIRGRLSMSHARFVVSFLMSTFPILFFSSFFLSFVSREILQWPQCFTNEVSQFLVNLLFELVKRSLVLSRIWMFINYVERLCNLLTNTSSTQFIQGLFSFNFLFVLFASFWFLFL